MPSINGTTLVLDVDGSALALITSSTLSIEQDLPDSSTKDSNAWAEHINGQRSWSVDAEGNVDMATGANAETLTDLILNQSKVDIEFAPNNTGDIKFTGTVSTNSVSIEAPNEDVASISGSMTGDGELVKSTVS